MTMLIPSLPTEVDDFMDSSVASSELKWREFQRIFLAALDRAAPLRRTRQRAYTGPPLSADTRQLLQGRRAALAQRDRATYRDVNKQCRAGTRRDARVY